MVDMYAHEIRSELHSVCMFIVEMWQLNYFSNTEFPDRFYVRNTPVLLPQYFRLQNRR